MRSDQRIEIRESAGLKTQIGHWTVCPCVLQREPVAAPNIDPIKRARNCIEAGGKDDYVEVIEPRSCLDALNGNFINRCLTDIN